jgi:diacylglycerol O-acyltransferase / wax synthase
MLLPMSPADAVFLIAESREHPMHVGSLLLLQPPRGADAADVVTLLEKAMTEQEPARMFHRRARRSLTTLGQWTWEEDTQFDIGHHVSRHSLPRPGRVLELLALCSRLHSTLLDRHRPLWELHLIEGLDDGRLAMYFKVHHAVLDGVAASRLLRRAMSEDRDARNMPAPWALPLPPVESATDAPRSWGLSPDAAPKVAAEITGMMSALRKTLGNAIHQQAASVSFSAPKSMLNVPITGARRFAAQSWPMRRVRQISKATGVTVNDVVLAICSGALRSYLVSLDALPDAPLIAMVPASLRTPRTREDGNAIGAVMCNLGTHLADPAARLATVHYSMSEGKDVLAGMSPLQIRAMTALGMSPLVVNPLLRLTDVLRPPFNLVISNIPGPRKPVYWNGARLDGLYPLSIPLDGQALNITVTSYSDEIAFGLTGCRRSVPHLQHLLGHLDDALRDLDRAVGIAKA